MGRMLLITDEFDLRLFKPETTRVETSRWLCHRMVTLLPIQLQNLIMHYFFEANARCSGCGIDWKCKNMVFSTRASADGLIALQIIVASLAAKIIWGRAIILRRHHQVGGSPSATNHVLSNFRAIYNHARWAKDLHECPTMAMEWF
jgi:hypothetical protein